MAEVSVIIPVYNVEKYLAKCLDSAVGQTFSDIEIICVNDGSTDSSAQILEKYAASDARIKIINQKNGGLSAARNAGFDISNAKYCYFLDSDDWIEKNTIETLLTEMLKNDVDCVVCSANNVAEDEYCRADADDRQNWFDSFAKPDGIYNVPLNIPKDIPEVVWNKLYKSEILRKYQCRFPEGLINEDVFFIWCYMIHCRNYYYLNAKLYNYLCRSNSIMGTRDSSPKILDILEIMSRIYQVVAKHKDIDKYKKLLTKNYAYQVKGLFSRIPDVYREKALQKIKEYYENVNHSHKVLMVYYRYKYYKVRNFILKIFSMQNIKKDCYVAKQVKIFGLKITIKNKKKTREAIEKAQKYSVRKS